MAKLSNVSGLSAVLQKMKIAKNKIESNVGRGLKRGGLYLQKKSQEIVPVDLGNLRDSSFCRNMGGGGFYTDIVVGYTADYAAIVHEDLTKAHGRDFNEKHKTEIAMGKMPNRGDNQQAKFLERPAREERRKILEIIWISANVI